MRTLSKTFGILGILFQLTVLFTLFINNEKSIPIICFCLGLGSRLLYLITDNILNTDVQK